MNFVPQRSQASRGALRIAGVSKYFGAGAARVPAVSDCTFDVPAGEITVVVGPSGCGKTTLLNAIGGYQDISGGEIRLDGVLLCGPGKLKADPGPDRVVVFQNGALFPWKTNLENVAFGPLMQGRLRRSEALAQGRALLAEVGLSGVEDNFPGEVSSGTRRRIEIVRALMNEPKVLLLDEPYRALDALTRSVMHEALLDVFYKTRVTVFFITHDLEEAIFLGHRVVIMTTRPCRPKAILDIDMPHPRTHDMVTTRRFQEYLGATGSAVREEALKAFESGERET